MKRILFLCFIALSCKSQFVQQPPLSNSADFIPECKSLVELINKKWYKHQKNPCHQDFSEVITLAQLNHDCLIRLHKIEIIQLFGKPDRKREGIFEYIFKANCSKKYYYPYCYLRIHFDKNYVKDAESGMIDMVE
ncbi:MAG: hypothetical protein KA974_01115 [Saprospiraceae bacterium]|nr:hypothetical protein [Saprospiraceae bacterium]